MENRYFLIFIDGSAAVAIKMPELHWSPMAILKKYADLYGFSYDRLTWAFVDEIPNPMEDK